MIDRESRDWLADLVEHAVQDEYDPGPNPEFLSDKRRRSEDGILEEGSEELAHFCGAKHQMNGWGTMGLILNLEDERRRMQNLITFLKSDVEFKIKKGFMDRGGCLVIPAGIGVGVTVLAFLEGVRNFEKLIEAFFITAFVIYMGPLFILYILSLIAFVVGRWFYPPKLNTDANDPWPFEKVEQLIAERERQQATKNSSDSL